MRLRIDTSLRTSHIRATAVLSKTQRAYSEYERGGGPVARFPSYLPRKFIQRPEPAKSSSLGQFTLDHAVHSVIENRCGNGSIRCSLAGRLYSSCREVTRTSSGLFRTTRGTLGAVLARSPSFRPFGLRQSPQLFTPSEIRIPPSGLRRPVLVLPPRSNGCGVI